MLSLSFDVLAWSAWAPGCETPEQWRAWVKAGAVASPDFCDESSPDVSFIPAMQRRRLSRLSKMSLWTLYQCIEGQTVQGQGKTTHNVRCVFASPHGEIHRTIELLQELAKGDPLSPMGFSLSVHNTAAGIYSILAANKSASTSVASGRDTLEQAVIEAVTQSRQRGEAVLLCYADEPLPAIYSTDFPVPFPFSLSMLICANADGGGAWNLRAEAGGVSEIPLSAPKLFAGITPLFLVANDEAGDPQPIRTVGERHAWIWSRK